MPLIIITAIIGILFIACGRSQKVTKGIERLSRLHASEKGQDCSPIDTDRSILNKFFNSVYNTVPGQLRAWSRQGLDPHSPYLSYPVEVLAGIRLCTTLCLPVSILLLTNFSAAGITLSIPCASAGMIVPKLIALRERDKFFDAIGRSLPHTADILYSLVLGGKNLDQAFRGAAATSPTPLKEVLWAAVREIELGSSREESFERLAQRYPVPQLASLLRTITEAERRGLELSNTLEVYSRELRIRNRDELRVRVSKAPIKMLVPLVFLILPSAIILAIGPALIFTFSQFLK